MAGIGAAKAVPQTLRLSRKELLSVGACSRYPPRLPPHKSWGNKGRRERLRRPEAPPAKARPERNKRRPATARPSKGPGIAAGSGGILNSRLKHTGRLFIISRFASYDFYSRLRAVFCVRTLPLRPARRAGRCPVPARAGERSLLRVRQTRPAQRAGRTGCGCLFGRRCFSQ